MQVVELQIFQALVTLYQPPLAWMLLPNILCDNDLTTVFLPNYHVRFSSCPGGGFRATAQQFL